MQLCDTAVLLAVCFALCTTIFVEFCHYLNKQRLSVGISFFAIFLGNIWTILGPRPEITAVLLTTIYHYDVYARPDVIIEAVCLWLKDVNSIQLRIVVSLQGGLGSQAFHPLSSGGVPKALQPVAGQPLITFPLRTLEDAGVKRVQVVRYPLHSAPNTTFYQ